MAAHKIRAVGRTEAGAEVVVYPETIASQVLCTVPAGALPLDEILNQYADEINENTSAIRDIRENGGDASDILMPDGQSVADAIGDLETGKAPLASPALTGTPTAPTPDNTDNSTRLATTAYTRAYISTLGMLTGSSSIDGGTF